MRRAEFARDAGVKPSVLNNYINRGSEPMGLAAFKLARKLKVSLEWLLDDGKDWPPPAPPQAPTAADLSDDALMFEVAKRVRLAELDLLKWLDVAEKIDWKAAQSALEKWTEGEPMPADLREAAAVVVGMHNATPDAMERFNPSFFCRLFHSRLPGSNLPLEAFDALWDRNHEIVADRAFMRVGHRLLEFVSRHQRDKLFRPGSNWSLAAERAWHGPAAISLPGDAPPSAEKEPDSSPKSRKKK